MANNIFGTPGNDTITPTSINPGVFGGLPTAGPDTISGVEGNDRIEAGGGNDSILGGNGNDRLDGASGNDTILGGNGTDTLLGWTGDDLLIALADTTPGAFDEMYGEAGNDAFDLNAIANLTNWIVDGGADTDSVDLIQGVLQLGTTLPFLNIERLDTFNTDMRGTAGNDSYDFRPFQTFSPTFFTPAEILVSTGSGNDLVYTGNTDLTPIFVNPGVGTGAGYNIVRGELGNDTLIGGGSFDSLDGGAENDSLQGGGGNDTLQGGFGFDTLQGLDGNDSLDGGADNDAVEGGGGNDTLRGGLGNDLLQGGDGSDSIGGEGGFDTAQGGEGNDTILAATGVSVATGGNGVDLLDVSLLPGSYSVNLATGATNFLGESFLEFENAVAGTGNDTITGSAAANVLTGGAGDDQLDGGAGNDILRGGTGRDLLRPGGTGEIDFLYGEDGDDGFDLNAVTNLSLMLIDGGTGADNADLIQGIVQLPSTLPFVAVESLDTFLTTFLGTAGADSYDFRPIDTFAFGFGAPSSFGLFAGGGNDQVWSNDRDGHDIRGESGNDTLLGGVGAGLFYGNDGADSIDGAGGADTVYGGTENDTLRGGVAADQLFGEAQEDSLAGDLGSDTLRGGDGNDTIEGGEDADLIQGENGDDSLTGGVDLSADTIDGGIGNDTIHSGQGADSALGGDGDDLIFAALGTDVARGGTGSDTLDTALFGGAYAVDLTTGLTNFGGESFTEFEALFAGAGNDTLTGSAGANRILGRGGNDSIAGAAGQDSLDGAEGADTVAGGADGDTIEGGTDADLLRGEDGNDSLRGGDDFVSDTLEGGAGNDTLAGVFGNDSVVGGDGDDLVFAAIGTDSAEGGAGNDTLDTADFFGSYAVDLSTGLSNFSGESYLGFEALFLGISNDTGVGTAAANLLSGRDGNDSLDGGSGGADTLRGGTGGDTLRADGAGDSLEGAGDNDLLVVIGPSAAGLVADAGLGDDSFDLNLLASLAGATFLGGDGLDTADLIDGDLQLGATLPFLGVERIDTGQTTFRGTAGADSYDFTGLAPIAFGVAWITLLYAGDGADTVTTTGLALSNTIYGEGGNDRLTGSATLDYLEGGTGADTLAGGANDDIYVIDSALDQVIEAAGEGNDTVFSSVSVGSLALEIELLTLTGAANFNATGNAQANAIVGNTGNNLIQGVNGDDSLSGGDGADTLRGLADNDTLAGGAGADQLDGGGGGDLYLVDALDTILDSGGIDTVQADISYVLPTVVERLVLTGAAATNGTGNAGNNTLTGNDGNNQLFGQDGNDSLIGGLGRDTLVGGTANDTLDGGAGNDRLEGGDGDDTYVVSGADVLVDAGGLDTVRATASFTLAAGFEALLLTGGAGAAGTGNAADNTITGNGGANLLSGLGGADSLSGGNGADTLVGGLGADTIAGGGGADVVRFASAAEGGDRILSYAGGVDQVEVSAAGFGGGLFAGIDLVLAGRYAQNAAGVATAAQAQFVYSTTTRLLSWDADGTGAGVAVLVADLTGAVAWNGGEITVIA